MFHILASYFRLLFIIHILHRLAEAISRLASHVSHIPIPSVGHLMSDLGHRYFIFETTEARDICEENHQLDAFDIDRKRRCDTIGQYEVSVQVYCP